MGSLVNEIVDNKIKKQINLKEKGLQENIKKRKELIKMIAEEHSKLIKLKTELEQLEINALGLVTRLKYLKQKQWEV